ncbi:hypothetical protein MTR67_025385 [Solanum verrucosum]|uniref:Integrase catalytic domain-containing protein n=1 Tax=Solanum verrucosum TaxID=315347 RepID=A0AAF0R034_SOLVR|nr:hypothetical protein MTR67_025385 [Solanum verrucosum]
MLRLHGVPLFIISDRGTHFTSQFWKSIHKGLGTQVKLSTTFHPQTNGYHSRIGMTPFEALHDMRFTSPIGWVEFGEVTLIGPELVHEAMKKVRLICERLKKAQSWQKSYADVRRRELLTIGFI